MIIQILTQNLRAADISIAANMERQSIAGHKLRTIYVQNVK